eukprot:TRINITY_DN749_c0_g1_i2.p1 TRINITY_DN749_c0_g1~~TRINITY_DN749_c0_g1_i2.p1  ORF type:complete len:715 (+),score=115.91 TRINITY_DN749_c0_g1_i2:218-2362(+)
MKAFVFCVAVSLLVALVHASCDYNIGSVADLTTVLAGQSGWSTVPTICFAAGKYVAPTSPLEIEKSQNWVGAQVGIDPSCGRRVIPGCSRLVTASSFNHTVETVIDTTLGIFAMQSSGNAEINVDGFVIFNNVTNIPFYGVGGTMILNFKNTYITRATPISQTMTVDKCYVTGDDGYFFTNAVHNMRITNSYFTVVSPYQYSGAGLVTAIGNTFFMVNSAFLVESRSFFSDNLFLFGSGSDITDGGPSVYKRNLFYGNFYGVSITKGSVTVPIYYEQNCFVDYTGYAINFFDAVANQTASTFHFNYFGSRFGATVYNPNGNIKTGQFPPYIMKYTNFPYTFTWSTTPVASFISPSFCARSSIVHVEAKPHTFAVGDTVNIAYSINIDSLWEASGVTLDMFDGMVFRIRVCTVQGYTFQHCGSPLVSGTWNSSRDGASITVPYTFTIYDYPNPDSVMIDNFFLIFDTTQPPTILPNFYPVAHSNITFHTKVPPECYGVTFTYPKFYITQAPRQTYGFSQICGTDSWEIFSINNTQNYFTYDSNTKTIDFDLSLAGTGTKILHYQVQSVYRNWVIKTVHTEFKVEDAAPSCAGTLFTWTFPRSVQTFPNWNLLSDCGDPDDGDSLTVVKIQKTKNRMSTDVVQLDLNTLYYIPEKVVLSVASNGDITLTSPSQTDPVTAGDPLPLYWNKDISFQYEVSDGVLKTWGLASVDSVTAN